MLWLPVDISIEALALRVVSWEAFGGVGNVESAIGSPLQGSEDAGSGGGAGQTHVQVTPVNVT